MGDYLHGWKRKAGLVTLGMACLFMTGWLRSIVSQEAISIPICGYRLVVVAHPEALERNNWKPLLGNIKAFSLDSTLVLSPTATSLFL